MAQPRIIDCRPARVRRRSTTRTSFLRQLVEATVNRFLDAEITKHLQAGQYERSDGCNGYHARQLKTRVGTIALAVPMYREGTFRTELFDRWQRTPYPRR